MCSVEKVGKQIRTSGRFVMQIIFSGHIKQQTQQHLHNISSTQYKQRITKEIFFLSSDIMLKFVHFLCVGFGTSNVNACRDFYVKIVVFHKFRQAFVN